MSYRSQQRCLSSKGNRHLEIALLLYHRKNVRFAETDCASGFHREVKLYVPIGIKLTLHQEHGTLGAEGTWGVTQTLFETWLCCLLVWPFHTSLFKSNKVVIILDYLGCCKYQLPFIECLGSGTQPSNGTI